MSNGFDPSKWSARNPLGIIALFISLIYGMSAALLGTSVNHLAPSNQTILVWFIVLFPFLVLAVFGWLVANHHRKLYGPSDYRSDEGFLNAANAAPGVLGQRLAAEVTEDVTSEVEMGPGPPERLGAGVQPTVPFNSGRVARGSIAQRIFVAENLVFRDLQRELAGSVRREVTLRSGDKFVTVDGIVETSELTYVVEIKLIRSTGKAVMHLRRALEQLSRIRDVADETISRPVRLVLAAVFDVSGLDEIEAEAIVRAARERMESLSVRVFVYSLQALLAKYEVAEFFESAPDPTPGTGG